MHCYSPASEVAGGSAVEVGNGAAIAGRIGLIAALLLALTGCGGNADEAASRQRGDGAQSAAIADPIMVDPGLGGQDQADAGLTAALPGSAVMPEIDRSKAAVAEAREQAQRLAGGKLAPAPAPGSGEGNSAVLSAMTAEQLATALPGTAKACVQAMRYSAGWAARLPAVLPPYPQSNVIEAAGAESAACHLRVARFLSPVSRQEAIDFYYARLKRLGTAVSHHAEGEASLLTLTTPQHAAYLVRVRERADGLVEIALASRN